MWMSNTPDGDRVIALAGLYQATTLVQQVARQGSADNAPFAVSIASLLRIDSESAAQVFGGRNGVVCGLKTLCRQLSRRGRDLELTRYSVCLLFLERKLARRHDLKRAVLDGIRNAIDQAEYFDTTHDCVLANLASIYTSTVSTLSPTDHGHGRAAAPQSSRQRQQDPGVAAGWSAGDGSMETARR